MRDKSAVPASKTPSDAAGKAGAWVAPHSTASEVAQFLKAAKSVDPAGSGRLIFSLDATLSRQPTWDSACQIQASMFDAVAKTGNLAVQLVYFRGFGECRASRFVLNASALRTLMTTITCQGGKTQIGKVLKHAVKETSKQRVSALVYIGDAMEEDMDALCHEAGMLAMRSTRAFMFQEGSEPVTERTFREIARLTGGAFFRLGPNSANELAQLLAAIAVYASGGRIALEAQGGRAHKLLLAQMSNHPAKDKPK